MSEEKAPKKWLVPAIAGLVLLTLTLIALFREPVELDPNTPEGTVQTFLQAIADEDYELAHDQLAAEQQEDCEVADIARAGPYESFSATLGDVEQFGEETIVHVTMRMGTDGGLGSGYSFDPGPYRLESEGTDWKITEVGWPYFLFECSL